ncbi:unnamed protein product [Pleuronectes platessa]|uniref:Uncharacterized protein n=1 Tax=Pleuronectes platessa TaxID=8262 RepID=A0A9N7UD08_PLEPL|nr:unnamed protein product [Pleuronectes platessa]
MFRIISANRRKSKKDISSDFVHQGIHHFPNSQSLPGTGAPAPPQTLRPWLSQLNVLFVFAVCGEVKTHCGRFGLGGGRFSDVVEGHRVHTPGPQCVLEEPPSCTSTCTRDSVGGRRKPNLVFTERCDEGEDEEVTDLWVLSLLLRPTQRVL